jgi:hypothetical protein
MFPDSPTMICRRCAHSFQIEEEMWREARSMIRFECPSCKYETVGSGIRAFLKFYPRLVESEKKMAAEGIRLIGYGIGDIMELGVYSWLNDKMQFQCLNCSNEWSVPFDPDTLRYKEDPKSFRCSSCLIAPTKETTREFFMSLNQTFEGAFKFEHAQWDIFSPLGRPAPVKKIQSKIFAEKFPI